MELFWCVLTHLYYNFSQTHELFKARVGICLAFAAWEIFITLIKRLFTILNGNQCMYHILIIILSSLGNCHILICLSSIIIIIQGPNKSTHVEVSNPFHLINSKLTSIVCKSDLSSYIVQICTQPTLTVLDMHFYRISVYQLSMNARLVCTSLSFPRRSFRSRTELHMKESP